MKKIFLFIFTFLFFFINSAMIDEEAERTLLLVFYNKTKHNIKLTFQLDQGLIRLVLSPNANIVINEKILKIEYDLYNDKLGQTINKTTLNVAFDIEEIVFGPDKITNIKQQPISDIDIFWRSYYSRIKSKSTSDNLLQTIFPSLTNRISTGLFLKHTIFSYFVKPEKEKFPEIGNLMDKLESADRAARYLLNLVLEPTHHEIDFSYNQLKKIWQPDNLYTKQFFSEQELELINNALTKAYDIVIAEPKYTQTKLTELEREKPIDTALFINNTDSSIFVANYIVDNHDNAYIKTPTKIGDQQIFEIPPKYSQIIPIMPASFIENKFLTNLRRRIVASREKDDLKPKLNQEEYKVLARAYIGDVPFWHAQKFTIVYEEEKLQILTKWEIGKKEFEKSSKDFTQKLQILSTNFPNIDIKQAKVHRGNDLSLEEIEFKEMRLPKVKETIQKVLDTKLEDNEVPIISYVFSGGGYRAMVEVLGYLRGAQKTNILDCATYMSGLSGSTWALSSWIASGKNIYDHSDYIRKQISDPSNWVMNKQEALSYTLEYELKKRFLHRSAGITDVIGYFGATLANTLIDLPTDFKFLDTEYESQFKNDYKQLITLSSLKQNFKTNQYPLAIFTAVNEVTSMTIEMEEIDKNVTPYIWFEFSPYRVGTHQKDGIWIDSKFLGRLFQNGESRSKDIAPEEPLSYLMGIWGSASAASFQEIYSMLPKTISTAAQKCYAITQACLPESFFNKLAGISSILPSSTARFLPGFVPNFGYELQGAPNSSNTILELVDGGHDDSKDISTTRKVHNFSCIPNLWRNVDLLIMCDSNRKGASNGHHLRASQLRAKKLNLPFPHLEEKDFVNINENSVNLFVDSDINMPIVIYMPCKKDDKYDPKFNPAQEAFTSTTNFVYSIQEFDKLSGLSEFIMEQNADTIKKAIYIAITKKRLHSADQSTKNLFMAMLTNDTTSLDQQLNATNLMSTDSEGNNILHIASKLGNKDMISIILSRAKDEKLLNALLKQKNKDNKLPSELTDNQEIATMVTSYVPKTLYEQRIDLFNLSMQLETLQFYVKT